MESEKSINFAVQKSSRGLDAKINGSMSEWLGTGLQNRLHQFESGWNLRKATPSMEIGGVVSLLAYTIVLFMVMVLPGKR